MGASALWNNFRQPAARNRARVQLDYWDAHTLSGAAHARQRVEFSRLIDKVRKDDTLAVSKLDRLGRDAVDVLATIRRLG